MVQGSTFRLVLLVSCLAYSSILKMEAMCFSETSICLRTRRCYVGVLISLLLFLLAAQRKEFFLDGLKKLEQRSHKLFGVQGGICRVNAFFQIRSFLFSL
jgi:hypothetical protein